ncbi:MAG TPA: pirin family protein, partial [Polyangiaceae bacterium]|nr:pirin family protein [Polyangiaceae bacterium]
MITLRRHEERRYRRRDEQEGWFTFWARAAADHPGLGFGILAFLNEERLPAGASVAPHPACDLEILTFVREGAVAHDDSLGHSGIIHAGEFHRMTATREVRHTEVSASRTGAAHVFQLGLRSSGGGRLRAAEQKRFSTAERRGVWCLVAAPDARRGSLALGADALVYSTLLDLGQHVVHELFDGRSAWLHLVQGEVTLGDLVLTTGDGAGVT